LCLVTVGEVPPHDGAGHTLLYVSDKENAMAASHEITCIHKTDRPNPHERITHVGGRTGAKETGGAWKITQQEAIQGIESGTWAFTVTQGGRRVTVLVAVSRFGNKYLKTEADGEEPNNLLSLPECS
jgi:hypothetical protein